MQVQVQRGLLTGLLRLPQTPDPVAPTPTHRRMAELATGRVGADRLGRSCSGQLPGYEGCNACSHQCHATRLLCAIVTQSCGWYDEEAEAGTGETRNQYPSTVVER